MNNSLFYWISYFLSDAVIFPLFELALVIVFLYGLFQESLNKNSGRVVKRGENARKIILRVASVIIAFVSIQIVQSTDVWKNYRVILILLNLFMSIYLCYFNSWFRNKIIGIWILFEQKEENL